MRSVGSDEVRSMTMDLGADLCGIASVERFEKAPEGHRPTDIWSDCRSVIVFAKRVPTGTIMAQSCVPYTNANNLINKELDRIAVELSLKLENIGIRAVPIPSDDPYEHWEPERQYGRAILSLRHAGHLAGLGTLGRNTLLRNERYGSMIQLGAVLVDAVLEPDPIISSECPSNCHRCIDSCPVKALNGITVDQKLCRPLSNQHHPKGYVLMKCSTCRRVCPRNNTTGKK